MKTFATLCTLVTAMALGSPAFAQKVSVEYAHQVDFSKFNTYKWGKNKGQLPDKLEDNHVKSKLDSLLQAKGLRRVDTGSADIVVTYQATEKTQQEVDNYADDDMGLGVGWGWGPGWGWGWGDMDPGLDVGYATSTVTTIRHGDILVDIADPTTKHMVFRGYATGAFHSNPIKEDKLIGKTLEKMFKNLPSKQT